MHKNEKKKLTKCARFPPLIADGVNYVVGGLMDYIQRYFTSITLHCSMKGGTIQPLITSA